MSNLCSCFVLAEELLALTVTAKDNFEKKLENIDNAVKIVELNNEQIGPLKIVIKPEVAAEITNMGAVNTVAAFESFAHDAMWQSFDIGFSKTVRTTYMQFSEWLEGRMGEDRTRQLCPKCPNDDTFWQLFAKGSNYEINFKNWLDNRNWKDMHTHYMSVNANVKNCIAVTQTILSHIKCERRRVHKPCAENFTHVLGNLLQVETSVRRRPPYFQKAHAAFVQSLMEYFLKKSCSWEVFLGSEQIKIERISFPILQFISKCFYGIRCLHVHGVSDRTTEEGVLRTKICEYDAISTGLVCERDDMNVKVTDYFRTLLKETKGKGKQMHIDYNLFQTIKSFYSYFIEILGNTCACVVYFKLCQFRRVDCTRGTAFGLSIDAMKRAIKYADQERFDFINKDITVQEDQWPSHQLPSTNDGGASSTSTSNTDSATVPSQAVASTPAKQLYSSVTGQNIQSQQPLNRLSQSHQSSVAAVDIEQRDRDSRSSSFIIHGLPSVVDHSDKDIVMELCLKEFGIQVDIVNTHRLGEATNKIQLLLVHVQNVDQAKQIISFAQKLRKSMDAHVRDNVYINANLTTAERRAAYELRRRNREKSCK